MEKWYGKNDIFKRSFRICGEGDYIWEKVETGDKLTVTVSRQQRILTGTCDWKARGTADAFDMRQRDDSSLP